MENKTSPMLRDQLLQECQAMARYAFTSGLQVPTSVVRTIESFSAPSPQGDQSTLEDEDMVSMESPEGIDQDVPPGSLADSTRLVLAHQKLSQIVAPATPRSILFLEKEARSKGFLGFLGSVPLVRHMMLAGIISLVSFVALSLSGHVGLEEQHKSIFELQGWPLLVNEAFYLSAAGMGASFAALFQLNHYIVRGTYDPRFASSYWIKFALGLIAGIVLAELVSIDGSEELYYNLTKPMLAMLGGFSAAVVYRVLRRLIDAVESLVRGETEDIIEAREQAARARMNQQAVQNRLQLAAELMQLRQRLDAAAGPEEATQYLDQMLEGLIPLESPAE